MKKILSRLSFIFCGLILFSSPTLVSASTYFVSNSGSDTSSGTQSSPWKTLTKGLSALVPGDTLYVRSGTYPHFSFSKSGTSNGYITISAYNNEPVLITGSSYDGIVLKGTSYVRLSGFEVTGATGDYGAGISVLNNGSIYPTYNIIENNRVHDNIGLHTQGILISNGSYNKIINNKSYNNYYSGIILISHPSISPNGITGNEITGNESYNNTLGGGNTDGIKIEGGGTKNTLISNNVVHGNGDDGIDTWNSSQNTLIGNTAYAQLGPGDGNGFKLGGYTLDSSTGIQYFGGNNIIKNNTAYGNKYNGFDSNGSGANYYESNLAYNNGTADVSKAWGIQDSWRANNDNRPSSIVNNNAYSNKTANYAKGTYTTTYSGNTESTVTSTQTSSPTPTPKPWTTQESDYSTWFSHYLQAVTGFLNGDFSENGSVDGVDYVLWLINYGK